MKKRIVLPFIALGALFCVGFGTIEYTAVKAEGEEPEVVEPVETEEPQEEKISSEEKVAEPQEDQSAEVSKYKELYEQAKKEYERISNYQFLGTTVGALVASLITIFINWLVGKVSREKLDSSLNTMKRYSEFMGENGAKATEYINKAQEYLDKSEEKYDKAVALVEQTATNMEQQAEAFAEEKAEMVKSRLEERQFFLSIISHSKEMVSSGAAEELVKYFRDKED